MSKPITDYLAIKANKLLKKKIQVKELRNLQAERIFDGANIVPEYGTLSKTNPTDANIDGWSEQNCDDFIRNCKARIDEIKKL